LGSRVLDTAGFTRWALDRRDRIEDIHSSRVLSWVDCESVTLLIVRVVLEPAVVDGRQGRRSGHRRRRLHFPRLSAMTLTEADAVFAMWP
jgi:hypothetical protein